MSTEPYLVGSVTVTPQGGGWYELSHASLTAPQREQGKEKADAAAQALSDSLANGTDQTQGDSGSMQQQPPIDAALQQAPQVGDDEEAAKLKAELEKAKEAAATAQAAQAEEQAARLAAEKERDEVVAKLETKTVVSDGAAPPAPPNKVPASVPRHFGAVLGDREKAELKRMGIETTEIILEENETIPPTGLYLGHNGRGYVIVPGEPVTVPNFLLGVLNDAVMSAAVIDSKSQKVLGWRNRLRYPYRTV